MVNLHYCNTFYLLLNNTREIQFSWYETLKEELSLLGWDVILKKCSKIKHGIDFLIAAYIVLYC